MRPVLAAVSGKVLNEALLMVGSLVKHYAADNRPTESHITVIQPGFIVLALKAMKYVSRETL